MSGRNQEMCAHCPHPCGGRHACAWLHWTDSHPGRSVAWPQADTGPDPLADPRYREQGIREMLRELIRPRLRLLDVVQVEVTSACLARCAYCPRTVMAGDWKNRHMDAATFAALWPLFRASSRVHLQGWGEPLLHPRFLDFCAFARRADCRISTTTCGLRMDEHLAGCLVRSGLDIVAFSLCGTDAASNAARDGADFDRVCASIRCLQAVRKRLQGVHLEIHLAYLLPADGLGALERLPDLLDELDVHAAVVSTLDYLPAPEFAGLAFLPGEADKIGAAREVLERVRNRAAAAGRAVYYSLPDAQPQAKCLEGIGRSVYVDAEGDMSPCIYVNLPVRREDPLRRVFGNCQEGDALAIWQGEDFAAFREALAGGRPDANCRACPKRFARAKAG